VYDPGVNVLPEKKKVRIFELASKGGTVRETSTKVHCHRETVRNVLRRIVDDRRRTVKLIEALETAVKAFGIDLRAMEVDALYELLDHLTFSCPIHPEAKPEDFSQEGTGCLLCQDAKLKQHLGMVRHHARRKRQGRPILPPWQKRT
jgi:hypothetical protein